MILPDVQYDVVAAGHICLDVTPAIPDTGVTRVEQLFRPGAIVNVGPCTVSTGGPVSNTGIGLVKLGCRVAFMAKVGDDDYGRIVRRLLETSGSAAGIRTTEGANTSYTVALCPPGIDRIFLHCPGTNDTFGADDVDFGLVKQAGLFHLGYPPLMRRLYEDSGAQLVEIFRRAKAAGATTSLDMSLPDPHSPSGKAPWEEILKRLLPHVDVFLPSLEESFFMLHRDEFLRRKEQHAGHDLLDYIRPDESSAMAARFLELGTGMTALKCGRRGYYFRTGPASGFTRFGRAKPGNVQRWAQRELWHPAVTVAPIRSATGSGDSSIAGFLTAFLRGCDLEDCLRTANCVGAQNLTALDATSGIRTWDETWARVQGGLMTEPLEVAGWRHDAQKNIWVGPHDAV